ncbi:endonuclease/exonuclease/phosphatase [Niastella koreensis]|uniref:Endonuclease/exonuclease/phosphatase n=2 Tax=Niastella koreensis TaxID=354356 RepID=G8TRM4_NIAKG|nr:endonuclease/exonuclease/phosphatase family protein [Niastella koreensis]AEW02171.1 Endonuclease/exonuclease/phosphatase [Niastella koreensis GR20-10]OQP45050.1 endonuclease/exonuclease/phosphatase [Niastella koreensis]
MCTVISRILFVILLFAGYPAFTQYSRLRFITYNMLEGMKLDTSADKPNFVNWLKQMNPDVLALQEVTGFTQASLEKLAQSYGHPYAVLLIEGEKYPVALTSKYPIVNVQKVSDNMDRGFIMARIKDMNIISLHFTPFDYRKRAQEVDLLLAHIHTQPAGKQWIIMGDFNTVSPADSANYSDGRMVANYQAYEKKYAPIQKLANGKLDYTVIDKIVANGFTDALKTTTPAFVKTVHPKRFEPKTGTDVTSRIDFIFVSRDLVKKIAAARVLTDDFTDYYSDHYPVLMDLK